MPTKVNPIVLTAEGAINSQIISTRRSSSSYLDFVQYPNITIDQSTTDLTAVEARLDDLENETDGLTLGATPLAYYILAKGT